MKNIENHKKLSLQNAKFVSSMFERLSELSVQREFIRSGKIPCAYENIRGAISPWPVLIGSHFKKEMEKVANEMGELLLKSIVLMATHFPKVFEEKYGVDSSSIIEKKAQIYNSKNYIIGRYDALISSGYLKVIEFNAGTNVGGWHLYYLMNNYMDVIDADENCKATQIIDEFIIAVERMAIDKFGQIDRPYNLLIEFESGEEFCPDSIAIINNAIESYGLNIKLFHDVNFVKVELTDDGAWLDGERIDVISSPIYNVNKAEGKSQRLNSLHWQDKLLYLDNEIHMLVGNKSCFSNLYILMQHNLLSAKDVLFIGKYIPLTYDLYEKTNEMAEVSHLIKYNDWKLNKDKYVIKRDGLLGGEQVYVGKFTSQDEWELVLSMARALKGWIIQQYYPSDQFFAPTNCDNIIEHDYIVGFFDQGGRYGGAGVRLMPSNKSDGVVNSAKGAQYTAVIEVSTRSLVI
jgi:hypothetical protein